MSLLHRVSSIVKSIMNQNKHPILKTILCKGLYIDYTFI